MCSKYIKMLLQPGFVRDRGGEHTMLPRLHSWILRSGRELRKERKVKERDGKKYSKKRGERVRTGPQRAGWIRQYRRVCPEALLRV